MQRNAAAVISIRISVFNWKVEMQRLYLELYISHFRVCPQMKNLTNAQASTFKGGINPASVRAQEWRCVLGARWWSVYEACSWRVMMIVSRFASSKKICIQWHRRFCTSKDRAMDTDLGLCARIMTLSSFVIMSSVSIRGLNTSSLRCKCERDPRIRFQRFLHTPGTWQLSARNKMQDPGESHNSFSRRLL